MPLLTWPGKHHADSKPASLLQDSILFPGGRGYPVPSTENKSGDAQDYSKAHTENRLILGDNLEVMSSLLPEYEGRINLIYADPPFFTNRKYSARIGRGEDSRKPEKWKLAEGYRDAWPDLDAYLQFLYERLELMYCLLAPNGTFYLHLDWHADAYARILLDEIFGEENLLNEIIWTYHGPSPIRRAFNRKHDTIVSYVKNKNYTFNVDVVREPYNPNTVITFKSSPKAGFGKVPDLERGKVPEDWWYFPVVARLHSERTGYPTQKPEALLERIILASSNPGDIVADFFCGSGTTPFIAAQNGRRFLACDATLRAIQTTRGRLADSRSGPFMIERSQTQAWKVISSRPSAFSIKISAASIQLGKSKNVEFWEVDPDWDGKTFKSAAQARRHTRSGEIPQEIKIKTGRNVCIRLVTIGGEQHQIVL